MHELNNEINEQKLKQEKEIYFSKISGHIQGNLISSKNYTSLHNLISAMFHKENSSYDATKNVYIHNHHNIVCTFSDIEITENYCFGKISRQETRKKDIFETIQNSKEKFDTLTVDSFTFFYVDYKESIIAYFSSKSIPHVNKVMEDYLKKYANANRDTIIISNIVSPDALEKKLNNIKIKNINLLLADSNDIKKNINHNMGWQMDLNQFNAEVRIKIKKDSYKKIIKNIIDSNNKEKKQLKKFEVTYNEEDSLTSTVIDYIKSQMTIHTTVKLSPDDVELPNKIKEILIENIKKIF